MLVHRNSSAFCSRGSIFPHSLKAKKNHAKSRKITLHNCVSTRLPRKTTQKPRGVKFTNFMFFFLLISTTHSESTGLALGQCRSAQWTHGSAKMDAAKSLVLVNVLYTCTKVDVFTAKALKIMHACGVDSSQPIDPIIGRCVIEPFSSHSIKPVCSWIGNTVFVLRPIWHKFTMWKYHMI